MSRTVVLHLVAILLVILNISDIRVAGLSSLIPPFDLMSVFYFAVFKNVFGIWFIFLLGIWNDALNGNPLGATAICYIIVVKMFSLLNTKMMIRDNFKQIWQQFLVFCFFSFLIKWAIISVFNGQFSSISTMSVQFMISIFVYVLMHKFFDYLSEKLLEN